MHRYPDKTVHVTGTFGTATVTIQGSNDGTNFTNLVDPQGNALSFTATGIEQILENPEYIRVNRTSGDGTTDVSVRMLCKSSA